MRLGIAGKGGAGKTTIAAVLSRLLARRGRPVLALDCDSDPHLALSIGLGEEGAARLPPLLDQSGPSRRLPSELNPARLVRGYGRPAPDGVTVLLAARSEKAGSGCTMASHAVVRDLIDAAERALPETVLVADMAAGLEHLSWVGGTLRSVDVLLVVAEPTVKSIITAERTHALAAGLGIRHVGLVGNRMSEADAEPLKRLAADRGLSLLGLIPDDEAVRRADRVGRCVLDASPACGAVAAIERLGCRLEDQFGAAA